MKDIQHIFQAQKQFFHTGKTFPHRISHTSTQKITIRHFAT